MLPTQSPDQVWLQVEGPQRVDFKFTDAVFKLPSREFKLPPFGKGW